MANSPLCFALFTSASLLLVAAPRAQFDFAPTGAEVVLDTGFTQVQTVQGPVLNVTGGIFQFRNVDIPQGTRVRGVGPNPMIWIVTGHFRVDGELCVDGSDGAMVMTLNTANFPVSGGLGGPGGGRGGDGTPSSTQRDVFGGMGLDPFGLPVGGGGGRIACLAGLERGSGGGGGAFGTVGDPFYLTQSGSGTSFQQQLGLGGQGGLGASGTPNRSLLGGSAGLTPFVDSRADNDFLGTAVNVHLGQAIRGELSFFQGGQGGGGGGDMSYNFSCSVNDPLFANDQSGGGGGGGGGCVVVAAHGPIVVGPTGRITANGGNGGGGEQAGSCNKGGGGGGGSGGMLVLASATAIGLFVKGETYANNDYDFVLSADGGICRTGSFGTPAVQRKYPANGQPNPASYGNTYDSAPLGGFGGMGVIQLLTPFGNNADGTNTYLDDGILLVRNGNLLMGAEKQRFLGWRGFPNAQGVRVDDFGVPLPTGRTDGDMRPAPILMPLF
ncbi:MAG: hypothetical protein H6838_07470 [Planctomycetes bacterium]|nr:hypothetical protein [Planctomycetota bacterium]MCB9885314.1 hypothetical protein [Planctomycetota bacterium]